MVLHILPALIALIYTWCWKGEQNHMQKWMPLIAQSLVHQMECVIGRSSWFLFFLFFLFVLAFHYFCTIPLQMHMYEVERHTLHVTLVHD